MNFRRVFLIYRKHVYLKCFEIINKSQKEFNYIINKLFDIFY